MRKEAWFTEDSLVVLEKYFLWNTKLKIFEFGMGASTVWLDKMDSVELLVSVEHDETWYNEVTSRVNKDKTKTILAERPYSQIIEQYDNEYFDSVIVDGRDRVKCIESSASKVKKGGILILDNSERLEYTDGINLLKDWIRTDYEQTKPDKYDFTYPCWTTSIFKKI
jgi:predicted O-methyltransferase YrrM